ncbi:hypothetical protein L6R44_11095 [Enterobacter cloacae complex sp. ECC445]|uniref:hypothetical protein n=1 Tax=Enterobacter cloacae complex sp. ECC445 TaxID=2913213 RepID=UPI001F32F4B6|nr:hypothetical protein [Enterobacter cloacae complex sp. ECC445]MCG0456652.1 hypothetical protein [Enterobacter cloacae complex sp. ECC445]
MKGMKPLTFIIYNYYLARAQYRNIKSGFLAQVEFEQPLNGSDVIGRIKHCYSVAYYEAYILPIQLEEHERMVGEYLAQARQNNL